MLLRGMGMQLQTSECSHKHHHSTSQLMMNRYGHALVTFDPKAEARVRLKIDLYIIPTVALLYLFCFIDRANIGNARLAGLEKDLKLTGYDYNAVLSIFYVSYIIFEVCTSIEADAPPPLLTTSTDPIEHLLQVDRPGLVHPHHLAMLRYRIYWYSVRAQQSLDLCRSLHPGYLRSRHAAWNCILYVSLVSALRARLPPLALHRHGSPCWCLWWTSGFCDSHS